MIFFKKCLVLILILIYAHLGWCQHEQSLLSLKTGVTLVNEVNLSLQYASSNYAKVGLELGYVYPIQTFPSYEVCGFRFWLPALRILNHQGFVIRPAFIVEQRKSSNFHSLHLEYGYTASNTYFYYEACGAGADTAEYDEFTEVWNTLGFSYRYNLVLTNAPRFYFHFGAGMKHKIIQRQYTIEAACYQCDTRSDRKEEFSRNSLNLSIGINYFIIE